MKTYAVTIKKERGGLQYVSRRLDGSVDVRLSSLEYLTGEFIDPAHYIYADECIVSAEMLPDGSCKAVILDIPDDPVPQWQPRPDCVGLWVYRVENKFWLQSVFFNAMLLDQEGLDQWRPKWGDDPIVEVYGPLPLSESAEKQLKSNQKKIERRLKKGKS